MFAALNAGRLVRFWSALSVYFGPLLTAFIGFIVPTVTEGSIFSFMEITFLI